MKGSLRSLLALAVMACAAFAMPAVAQPDPGGSVMTAHYKVSEQGALPSMGIVDVSAAPATSARGAFVLFSASDGGPCILDGKQTPAKPAPSKKGGGKKKCLTAAGPGDDEGDGGDGQEQTGIRRLLT